MAEKEKGAAGEKGAWANEGEGSRSGAKQYNEATQRFAKSGKVGEKAREAKDAVEGDEQSELADAEAEGKRHAHGEDPALKKKS